MKDTEPDALNCVPIQISLYTQNLADPELVAIYEEGKNLLNDAAKELLDPITYEIIARLSNLDNQGFQTQGEVSMEMEISLEIVESARENAERLLTAHFTKRNQKPQSGQIRSLSQTTGA